VRRGQRGGDHDGSTAIVGTLVWNGSWLTTEMIADASVPAAAWNITNVWPAGPEAFGY